MTCEAFIGDRSCRNPNSVDVSEKKSLKYKQGWRAQIVFCIRISLLVRERNCAFINCKGQGFADNSSISGFDFPDDARALITTDWDFDGDLDVWVSCRNAPRIRLLENRSMKKADWLGIKLEGDGVSVTRCYWHRSSCYD